MIISMLRLPKWRNWQTRRIQNPVRFTPGVGSIPTFGISNSKDLQQTIDEKAPNSSDSDADSASRAPPNPPKHTPDLQTVIDGWPDLPEAVRAGIMAMVKASKESKR